jgi:hypothetical protein
MRLLGMMFAPKTLLLNVAIRAFGKSGFAIRAKRIMSFCVLHLLGNVGMHLYPYAMLAYFATHRTSNDQTSPP